MSRRRAVFFETRFFGMFIGIAVFLLSLAVLLKAPVFPLNMLAQISGSAEQKLLDVNFQLKFLRVSEKIQEGVSTIARNPKISDDILIVGIDSYSLSELGKWPFPRYMHADLINAFARIKNQDKRERALFLDTFFSDPDSNPSDDAVLARAMGESGRVYLESILSSSKPDEDIDRESWERQSILIQRQGTVSNVSGLWEEMKENLSVEASLKPFALNTKGYGHANFEEDGDGTYRRQPLIAKISRETEKIPADTLKPGYTVDGSAFERLVWLDKNGIPHTVKTPLTSASIDSLIKTLEKNSPPVVEDADQDGTPDKTYFLVRKFKEFFIPSITLSLALDYFNKKPGDIEVKIGEYIKIPSPQTFNPDTGNWEPYKLATVPEIIDENGTLTQEAKYRVVPEIRIPINDQGQMRVNFMGPPSSATQEGYQTFPVRPYSTYATMTTNYDPTTWRPTRMVQNKIIMVGAFAKGMAQDEKPTPYGLMFGIEMHANALNTILMDNFIQDAPWWLNASILLVMIALIALLTSNLKGLLGFVVPFSVVIFLLFADFLAVVVVFEQLAIVLNYSIQAVAMIVTLVSIIAYRAMTEEKDKRRIKDMFGKYVSPAVVNDLMVNPPELGGVDKTLTVFFSDIRGFSTFSENMAPQELINHLNVYFTAMTDLVLEYGGTLDKYVGDELMCFWGAPLPQQDHAILACKCAIRQMQKLHELNEGWPESLRFNIGIGLNTGIMTVGNVGSSGRMNYTIMGDNVNLGARLEGTNKEYGTNIIISEYTYGLVKDKFVVRELDNIRVKGKNKPVLIYELIDCLESLDPPVQISKKGRVPVEKLAQGVVS